VSSEGVIPALRDANKLNRPTDPFCPSQSFVSQAGGENRHKKIPTSGGVRIAAKAFFVMLGTFKKKRAGEDTCNHFTFAGNVN
jgi:hypothetical protein